MGGAAGLAVSAIFPVNPWTAISVGETLGSILDGLTARPSPIGDAHYSGATYETPINFGLGQNRYDGQLLWAQIQSNGSYYVNNGAPGKGKSAGDHYYATFGVVVSEIGVTCPDGTQIEWPMVLDRIWMSGKIAWQSSTATVIPPWSSTYTYQFGDYATGSDNNVYYSDGQNNLNHDPTVSSNQNVWWTLATVIDTNVELTIHPQISESSFTQAADSTQVAALGVANCSAYRGLEWFMVQNMDLFNINNSLPQMVSIEAHTGAPAWSSTVTYQALAWAEDTDANLYRSKLGSNLNNALTDTTYWEAMARPTYADYFAIESLRSGMTAAMFDYSASAIVAPAAYSGSAVYGYGQGAVGADLNYYHSVQDGNQGHDPTLSANDDVWWAPGVFPSPMGGVLRNQRITAQQAISQYFPMLGQDACQIDGVFKTVARGSPPAVTVPDGDLSAVQPPEGGGQPDFPARVGAEILVDRRELHTGLVVKFAVIPELFRIGGEYDPRVFAPNYGSNPAASIDTGLSMDRVAGAQIAGYLLDCEWLESGSTYTIYLPKPYGYLAPTDCLLLTWNNQIQRFKIVSMNAEPVGDVPGVRYVLEITPDYPELLVRDEDGSVSNVVTTANRYPVPCLSYVASPAIDFTPGFAAYPGFYVWCNAPLTDVNNPDGSFGFTGGTVYYTFDPPTTTPPVTTGRGWVLGPTITAASALGSSDASALLGAASGPGYETTNSFQADLAFGDYNQPAITSISEASVNNGFQWMLMGDEIIGVVNAGAVSSGHQTIGTGLVRGLNGTPYGAHTVTEPYAMAPAIGVMTKVQVPAANIGDTVYVRVLTVDQAFYDTIELSCVISQNVPPYVANAAPMNPSSIAVSSTTYNGQEEVLTFAAEFTGQIPAGQTIQWRYSTNAGSTWTDGPSTSAATYQPPAFSSGTMMVDCQCSTLDGRVASGYTASSDQTYVIPSTPQSTPQAPDSVSVTIQPYSGTTEVLLFTPVFTSASPTPGQWYVWEYSTDGGSTWNTGSDGSTYIGSFGSGTLMARCAATTLAGSASEVNSADTTYSAPPSGTATYFQDDTFTGTGAAGPFTLSESPLSGSVSVYVNGIIQPTSGYYTVSGTTLTFLNTTAPYPPSGFAIDVRYAYS